MIFPERTPRNLLRAHGRCTGALIFSVFGGCWLLLACFYFRQFHLPATVPICIAAGLLAMAAWRLDRSRPAPVLEGALSREKKADDRTFMVINAVTYGGVFLLFAILPRMGLENYVFPAFVALIGLHFFPMPPLYRHMGNFVTGAFLVAWAIFCVIAFRADGDREAAFAALGAGAALWCSAVWALFTARGLFEGVGARGAGVDSPPD